MSETPRTIDVSSKFMDLRSAFETLNRFLWSTELAYGYLLVDPAGDFSNPKRRVRTALAKVTNSQVWYPTRQGSIRYNQQVGEFLGRIEANTSMMYRAVMVFAVASFEEYLAVRVAEHRAKERNWGPYLVSLSKLAGMTPPVQLHTLLCADFCRVLRNLVAHEPSADLPASISDDAVKAWVAELAKINTALAGRVTDALIRGARRHVFGEAAGAVAHAKRQKKALPVELFYMLFTLANLDKLALEIEMALPPTDRMEQITLRSRRSSADHAPERSR